MKRILLSCLLVSLFAPAVLAQTAPDEAELTRLLKEFLAGASRNDVAMHDRFWAEELVYTGSTGRRRSKTDVMRDVRGAPAPKPDDPKTVYGAEDIRIQQYGETAIVAFRLVATVTGKSGATHTSNFFNTGTLLKRNGQWRVIAWQATRIPQTDEDKAAILNLQQQWETGFGNHDAAAMASLFTDDCVRMPAGDVTSVGRPALEASYRKDFAELWKTRSSITIKTDEVVVSGDYAFARGTDTTTQEKNGTTSSETGKWLATYRRQPDGSWKYFWSTYNSNQ